MAPEMHPTLLPDPECLHLTHLEACPQVIIAHVSTISSQAQYPLCQYSSEKIHSRYTRLIADLPWMGRAVQLELHTRRFFCQNRSCPRQIFTERLPSAVEPYARRTTRLTDVFMLIGFALGAEAGKRLVEGMSLVTSPDTLLRLIRAKVDQPIKTPRVLGVDDFSFCKRRTYGTILIDLEKRIPVDILPDRETATLEKWLKAHAGVEIISRDRGGPYAEGARLGAPDAQQVADRFHLLVNLSEALKPFFNRKQESLKVLGEKPPETFSEEEAKRLEAWYAGHSSYTKKQLARSDTYQQARVERYHKVHELRAKGAEITLIAHQTGLSRQTVHTYLKLKHPPGRKTGKRSGSVIDPYKEYLVKRWNEGVRNAQQVYREIKAMGYTGSDQPIQR
jgi:transposase